MYPSSSSSAASGDDPEWADPSYLHGAEGVISPSHSANVNGAAGFTADISSFNTPYYFHQDNHVEHHSAHSAQDQTGHPEDGSSSSSSSSAYYQQPDMSGDHLSTAHPNHPHHSDFKWIHPYLRPVLYFLLVHTITLGILVLAVPTLLLEILDDSSSKAAFYQACLNSGTAAIGFFINPVYGVISDKKGRKRFMLLSAVGSSIAYTLLAAMNNLPALILGAIIRGFTDVSYTMAHAALGDLTTVRKFVSMYGRISAAAALGIVVGPLFAVIASVVHSTRGPFALAALLAIFNIVWVRVRIKESLHYFRDLERKHSRSHNADNGEAATSQTSSTDPSAKPGHAEELSPDERYITDPEDDEEGSVALSSIVVRSLNPFRALNILTTSITLWGLALALFLYLVVFMGMLSVFFVYTKERFGWRAVENGLFVFYIGVIGIFVQAVVLPWAIRSKQMGERNTLTLSVPMMTVQLLLFGFLPIGWLYYPVVFFCCISSCLMPTLRGMISRQIGADLQGELQGAISCLSAIATIVGPLVSNGIFAYSISDSAPIYFPGACFVFNAFLILISGLIILYVCKRHHISLFQQHHQHALQENTQDHTTASAAGGPRLLSTNTDSSQWTSLQEKMSPSSVSDEHAIELGIRSSPTASGGSHTSVLPPSGSHFRFVSPHDAEIVHPATSAPGRYTHAQTHPTHPVPLVEPSAAAGILSTAALFNPLEDEEIMK